MRLGHLSILLSILIALSNFPGFAQQAAPPAIPPNDNPAISGRILDAENGKTIEYANVVLHSSRDSSMVQGTISDPRGRFVLRDIPPGEYYLVIHFIGYEDVTRNNISVRHNGGMIDLGDIRLHLTPIQMEEVEVAADRAPVVYQIDKKVINVDRQLTAASGTAIDVLQNVPSVTVDLDGNVQLRGSGSFTVLIDGRPSTLEGSEALEQIPSSAIENIEIITNPSARYNPEGMAGIINVVMKKNGRLGNSGVVNLTGGLDDKYGGDFLYTLRQPAFSLHFGADYNHRFFGGIEREENRFFNPPAATIVTSDGISNRQGERWSVRGGFELPLSVRDLFTVSLRYG
ncbi:MAG: TonB-dependent receptor, partial [Bacteroidetes bacterium]|nr:TonB-dependent receptor [Bacteroidota bacterium]